MTAIIGASVTALVVILIFAMGYVKAPPDQAFIISGLRKEPRILIGRAGVKIPFFERVDKLYLGQMTVDIKTEQSVPTNDLSMLTWTLLQRFVSQQTGSSTSVLRTHL